MAGKAKQTESKPMSLQTSSSEEALALRRLHGIFQTNKKTIDEYSQAIRRHNAYRSVRGYAHDGMALDDRGKLMDLYDACVQQDAHLAGVLETLESQIVGERYMLARQNEKGRYVKDLEATRLVQGTQFIKLIKGIVEAKLYGYSAFEILPEIDKRTGKLKQINMIERRNVLPDQRRIVKCQGTYSPGWSFDDPQYEKNYVLINTGGLGLFSATTPSILAKKFTLANYVNFSHTYGMPIVHAKTSSESTSDRQSLANKVSNAAQQRVLVTSLEDEIDIKSFTMSNSEQIYMGLISLVNKDVSNIILGSESMGGATQSYVGATKAHQDIFRDRIEVYREFIENVMNEEILPRLVAIGYIKDKTLEFRYSKRIEMSNKDQIDLYAMISDKFEVSPDEIENAFGIKVGRQFNFYTGTAPVPVPTEENNSVPPGAATPGDDDYTEEEGEGEYHEPMSDEEYFKRYGRLRSKKNFL